MWANIWWKLKCNKQEWNISVFFLLFSCKSSTHKQSIYGCIFFPQSHLKKSIVDNDLLPWRSGGRWRGSRAPCRRRPALISSNVRHRPGCSTFRLELKRCWEFIRPGSSMSSHPSRNSSVSKKSPFSFASKMWPLTAGVMINQRMSNIHSGTHRSRSGRTVVISG